MRQRFVSKVPSPLRAVVLLALVLPPTGLGATQGPSWTQAFGDTRAAIHVSAIYPDAQGRFQTLEFWRDAQGRVVRRTANRAELRLTPANDGEDLYQLRNLVNHTAFNVHRVNLFRVGVFSDRWSVQHLLDRPVGTYALSQLGRKGQTGAGPCDWWRVNPASGATTEVCWSALRGIPLLLKSAGRTVLSVSKVQPLTAFPPAVLPQGWHEYDADQDLAPD